MVMITVINTEGGDMGGRERDALGEYLRDRGLKMTETRETVLDAFLQMERHVTVDELLEAARRADPSIGQATVFRTIKLLAEAGLAREACSDDGARRFEHAYRHEHHDHLICVSCGRVVEFSDAAIERAQDAIYKAHGFKAVEHRMELKGICPRCAVKKRG
jgi:Fur family transcriptional regulator, ferric uptake regulator